MGADARPKIVNMIDNLERGAIARRLSPSRGSSLDRSAAFRY